MLEAGHEGLLRKTMDRQRKNGHMTPLSGSPVAQYRSLGARNVYLGLSWPGVNCMQTSAGSIRKSEIGILRNCSIQGFDCAWPKRKQ